MDPIHTQDMGDVFGNDNEYNSVLQTLLKRYH